MVGKPLSLANEAVGTVRLTPEGEVRHTTISVYAG